MWDQRYASDEYAYGKQPNTFLKQQFHAIPKGNVLCLAEGEGRNGVFLAQQGYSVVGVDGSSVGRDKAQRLAAEKSVNIDYIVADLAEFPLGESCWDGVVSIFCHLPPVVRQRVLRDVVKALKPQGVLLLEAYTPKQLSFGTGGPPQAEMMMHAEQLREDLVGLTICSLQEIEREVFEGKYHAGIGAVVQLIAKKGE